MARRFTEYANLLAFLTSQPTTYRRSFPLYTNGGGADDASIIGYWGRNKAGVIVPKGEIDLALVSTTPVGTAASVAGAVVTVSAGHSISQQSRVLRVWNVSDAALVADVPSGSWSLAGNDVTVPQASATAIAALLGASKVVRIHVEGVSEFSIGGATSNIQTLRGVPARFAAGLLLRDDGLVPATSKAPGLASRIPVTAGVTISRSAEADGQYAGIGYAYDTGATHHIAALGRLAAADKFYTVFGAMLSPSVATTATAGAPAAAGSHALHAQLEGLLPHSSRSDPTTRQRYASYGYAGGLPSGTVAEAFAATVVAPSGSWMQLLVTSVGQ